MHMKALRDFARASATLLAISVIGFAFYLADRAPTARADRADRALPEMAVGDAPEADVSHQAGLAGEPVERRYFDARKAGAHP